MALLVPDDVLSRFHDSFERVNQHENPTFLDAFYERFLSSDEVRAKFEGVELARVKRMVRELLYVRMLASDGNQPAHRRLVELGVYHDDRGIGVHLYELWLDSLMSVVEEMDPKYDSDVDLSWRAVLRVGISIMTHQQLVP